MYSKEDPNPGDDERLQREQKSRAKAIAVVELFGPTIQGEGPLAGSKTMFVRFGGCDYRCAKCDSLHAVIPEAVKKHASYLTQDEIADQLLAKMEANGTKWVTLSGGNPLMWDLDHLVQRLQEADKLVAVETQGSLYQDWLREVNCLVLSPKSPGMGEKFEPKKFTEILVKARTGPVAPVIALKVVIFSQQDIDFALDVAEYAESEGFPFRDGLKYFSLGNPFPPELDSSLNLSMEDAPSLLDSLMYNYRLLIEDMTGDPRITDWRFLPQLHVLAYGNEAGK